MDLLTKEQAAAAGALRHEDVDVPEWGGAVRIAELSAVARAALQKAAQQLREDCGGTPAVAQVQVLYLAHCLVGADGLPLLTQDELGRRSHAVVERLYARADALNLLSPAKVEAEAKN